MTEQTDPDRGAAGRPVIVHYHLFKNAGTSVDATLRANFGDRWAQQEFAPPDGGDRPSNHERVAEYIAAHPEISALSSHTANLPVPAVTGVDILPVIFVRHPIDRLRSAYEFERRQEADTRGARLAKETDMAGYLRALLDLGTHRGVRNFHVLRLAYNEGPSTGSEIERARRAVERLPFVGLVEAFDRSMAEMEAFFRPRFPDYSTELFRRNVSQSEGSTLESRLRGMRDEIGPALYAELVECNAEDMEIFELVARRFGFEAPAVA